MNNFLGIYSTSLILSEFWHLYWNSSTPWFEQSLCSLIGTFKRYCLIQNAFSTLKVLSWNLSPICLSFYRIRKIVVFFLEARSNSKIPLIKTKCVVIYHGKKKMVVTMVIIGKGLCNVKWSENVGNHHYWSYFFFLCGFSFMSIGLFQKKKQGFEDMEFPGVLRK